MSATDSEEARKSGRLRLGISGRVPSEWVADLRRNQWPAWVGIRNGGLRVDQAKRLKTLEQENARLKRLVADLSLDNSILKEVASGNF